MNYYDMESIYGERFDEFAQRLIITSVRRGCVVRGIFNGIPVTSDNCNTLDDVREKYLSYDKEENVVVDTKEEMVKPIESLPAFNINDRKDVLLFLDELYNSRVKEEDIKLNVLPILKDHGYMMLMDYIESKCVKLWEAEVIERDFYNGRDCNKELLEGILIGDAMTDMRYKGGISNPAGELLDVYTSRVKENKKIL